MKGKDGISSVDEPTVARFHFEEKGKVQPQGYDGLGINTEVTVILKGRIAQIGSPSWEKGKGFELEISSCEISAPAAGKMTLSDALDEARTTARRVK